MYCVCTYCCCRSRYTYTSTVQHVMTTRTRTRIIFLHYNASVQVEWRRPDEGSEKGSSTDGLTLLPGRRSSLQHATARPPPPPPPPPLSPDRADREDSSVASPLGERTNITPRRRSSKHRAEREREITRGPGPVSMRRGWMLIFAYIYIHIT